MDDPRIVLTPEALRFLKIMEHQASSRPYEASFAMMRKELEAIVAIWGGPREYVPYCEDICLSGGIPLRIYHPDREAPLPLFFYIHGGGWTRGNLNSHDKICRSLANRLHVRVVAVDYHLAPEHPYPHGLNDVKRVYQWILDNQDILHYESGKIVVGGDSGGGTLATELVCATIEENLPRLGGLFLFYPSLDLTGGSESMTSLSTGYFLTQEVVLAYIQNYTGGDTEHVKDWAVSPLFYDKLDQFPPTSVVVCGADPIRDDGVRLAEALEKAGVPSRLFCVNGTLHAFLQFYDVFQPQCDETYSWVAARLKEWL